jgi:hypothetical protein
MERADILEFARKTAFVGRMDRWLLKYLLQVLNLHSWPD